MIGTMSQQWVARIAAVGATVGTTAQEWTYRPTTPPNATEAARHDGNKDRFGWLD